MQKISITKQWNLTCVMGVSRDPLHWFLWKSVLKLVRRIGSLLTYLVTHIDLDLLKFGGCRHSFIAGKTSRSLVFFAKPKKRLKRKNKSCSRHVHKRALGTLLTGMPLRFSASTGPVRPPNVQRRCTPQVVDPTCFKPPQLLVKTLRVSK